MSKVKTGLTGLTPEELALKSAVIQEAMDGNANFPTPTPTLVQIETARDFLVNAIEEAQTNDSVKIAQRRLKFIVLKVLLTQLGAYVQNTSGGDAEKIISSGFEVVQRGGPIGPLPAATDMSAKPAGIGKAKLNWNAVRGTRVYIVERCVADPAVEASWTIYAFTTQSRYTAEGLTSGQLVWFRVKPIGAAGVGEASDPARCMIS